MDLSHKFKPTTSVTLSVNKQQTTPDKGFCEIVEKRVKKRDLIKYQKKKDFLKEHKERNTVITNHLEMISSFDNTESLIKDQRKSVGQRILDNYFPNDNRPSDALRALSPILFEADEDEFIQDQVRGIDKDLSETVSKICTSQQQYNT